MNAQEIQKMIQVMADSGLAEMEVSDGPFRLKMSRYATAAAVAAPPAAPAAEAPGPGPVHKKIAQVQEPASDPEEDKLVFVESPIVGTFYEASAPGEPAFAKKGDRVRKGQVVCIIEAMKLMNEIKSDVDGLVEEVLVVNEQMVEFGHRLIAIRPEGA